MKKIAIILAEGFEELEAVTVIDVLRRAKIEVIVVGFEQLIIKGAHQIELKADCILTDIDVSSYDGVVLPGGLPGAETLAGSKKVQDLLQTFAKQNKLIAAICAAPWALATAGVLKAEYTCYPSFENIINCKGYQSDKNVVKYENIITSRGPATAMEFALELVNYLTDDKHFEQVKSGLLF